MADPHPDEPLAALMARGLIAEVPPPRRLPRSNHDRRADQAHDAWVAHLPDGAIAKLTVGRNLGDRAERHAALARACPSHVPALLFHEPLPAGEVLAEEFFDGVPLESALREDRLPREKAKAGFTALCSALAATGIPSTETARQAEWRVWTERLVALPVWTQAEATRLRESLLPSLYPLLAATPPVTRWTNGDFLSANILLNAAGETRLIDAEFAMQTHFFAEDAVRFRALSPAVRSSPGLFADAIGEPGLPWHLYFWLRQLQLEAENNSPEYLARVRPVRLGSLRRLAEHVLSISLEGWSVPAIDVQHRLEEARWMPVNSSTTRLAGWCHVPAATELLAIVALDGDRRVAGSRPSAREDVRAHFDGDARALLSGFALATDPVRADTTLTLCADIDNGIRLPFLKLPAAELPKGVPAWDDYAAWAAENDPDPSAPSPGEKITGPLFSILLPVYDPPVAFLETCIGSVIAQHYPQWELCIVDDGSTRPEVAACLRRFAAAEPRIRVQTRAENGGISRATNDALAAATGGFVVLLDHDDLLRPHALLEFARFLEREPAADAVYSDEDKISAEGRRVIPFLKPDCSPEFLLRVMYVGHALCVRTAVARAAGGFDPAFDGVQDYEFFLRVTEAARAIGHIPRMLYHWRQSAASSALHGNVKGDMDEKQAAAVRAHLQRVGRTERVIATGGHRVELHAASAPSSEVVRAAGADEALAALQHAAASSRADVLVLLTAEALHPSDNWMGELAALAARPDSGCVAPRLHSRDGRVLESGWTLGPAGFGPVMRGFDCEGDGYHGSLRCSREVAAVSPLCVALRRDLLATVLMESSAGEGWFDFCVRLRGQGKFHRVCATAIVQVDRSWRDTPVAGRLAATAPVDPFYNRHFDPAWGDYRLRDDLVVRSPRWHLDTPPQTAAGRGCLLWRGWCYDARGKPIRAVRLRAGELTITGVVGLPRPDVRAALPRAADDNTGFEIRGTLPAGRHTLTLEAQTTDGQWYLLTRQSLAVKRRLVPLWLGGGDWTELMFFQMPAHMAHPARPVRLERFPAVGSGRSRPRMSIVTPSYQHARFLGETMRSVLEQDGVDCDYVVQDGGSTDGSVEVITRLAAEKSSQPATPRLGSAEDEPRRSATREGGSTLNPQPSTSSARPRLVAWESAPDSGQADAIIRGFTKTSGAPDDVMAWLNSDDLYLPGALPFVADYFARHPEVDLIYGHRIVVNEESQEIARWFLPKHDDTVLRLNDFVPQETVFWRRRIWDKVGGLDRSFKFAMDWDLLLRFQSAGARIVRVPCFLACFRVHPGQKTSAEMHDVGRKEIDALRTRANGRAISAADLERDSRLIHYLRRSALIEYFWRSGIRLT
jgi:glycosyltransferase involved in cell wall biosynthesis